MKISKLDLFRISIPFTQLHILSKIYGAQDNAHAVIFKIHTEDRHMGLGEADPLRPLTQETASSVMAVTRDVIGPQIIGRDPIQKW